jgi:hypothetical protein
MKVGQSLWSAGRPFLRSTQPSQQRVLQRKVRTNFVVSLFKSGLSKAIPAIRSVNRLSSLESDIQVAALDGKVESGTLILHKMKCDLL